MSSASASSSVGHFDLVVIGGGSGGLAAAKEAAKQHPKKKVLCLDFVAPSPAGTKWGVGGTCVNVGCIPKKLMHHAANIGRAIHNEAEQFGWDGVQGATHDWARMQGLIGDYIHSLNYSYRSGLRGAGVTYAEAKASFDSESSLVYTTSAGKATRVTFDRAIVAAGGRPAFLPIPGWQLAQTSDDVFWRKTSPGKTLIIGAGYIALELASFLRHFGNDVSIMVRGEVLRKMDKQAGQMLAELMERDGARFINPANPLSFRSLAARPSLDGLSVVSPGVYSLPADAKGNARLLHEVSGVIETRHLKPAGLVTYAPCGPGQIEVTYEISGVKATETFDTVLFATGRVCDPVPLGLAAAKVAVTPAGKVVVDAFEATTNPRIFAIGDVAAGVPSHAARIAEPLLEPLDRPELTPVAIQAGQLLARRLWGKDESAPLASSATPSSGTDPDALMDYANIATTVFTSPSEYAFVGLSEEQARLPKAQGGIGAENVEVYWSRFGNLEISPLHPHLPALRSKAFTGRQLWAEAYATRKGLLWPELMFDPSGTTCRVMYTPVGSQVEEAAAVTEQQVVAGAAPNHGTVTYTIKLQDGLGDEVKGVLPSQLRLQDEVATESAEVLYKANCLAKLIVDRSAGERVVGLHFVGPQAGEVVQGFALAVSLGATKKHFDKLVGIHPTAAEEFSVLTVTQSSGATMLKQAGCGGGSCG